MLQTHRLLYFILSLSRKKETGSKYSEKQVKFYLSFFLITLKTDFV